MTQKIFDTDNAEDMTLLWSILPDDINKITKPKIKGLPCFSGYDSMRTSDLIKINWHDKTEITKPIQEATEADVGKLCVFWNDANRIHYGVLAFIGYSRERPYYERKDVDGSTFNHCRRLTRDEIRELC